MQNRFARAHEQVQRIERILSGKSSLLIVMQDNPDPDAIASAAALRRLANELDGTHCSIAYGGTIGRGENRAVADYLALNFRPFRDVDVDRYDLVALVDSQPGAGNNALPATTRPDIVLDHHPLRDETRGLPFVDVRSRYGALSTMLFEYLQAAGITPGPPLATALLYGIRSDTQDLDRQASQADVEAVEVLYTLANTRMLAAIQRGSVDRAYFRTMANALRATRRCGNVLYCAIGDLPVPDITGEIADWLSRLEGIDWTLCWGSYKRQIWLSLRSSRSKQHAGQLARALVDRLGSGGGHARSAGGQIMLDGLDENTATSILRGRFRELTGVSSVPDEPLV